jgi:hypothetical protein
LLEATNYGNDFKSDNRKKVVKIHGESDGVQIACSRIAPSRHVQDYFFQFPVQ